MDENHWICPWDICGRDDAQVCRSQPKGCGGIFGRGVTLEQAKKLIGPLPPTLHDQRIAALESELAASKALAIEFAEYMAGMKYRGTFHVFWDGFIAMRQAARKEG